MVNSTCWKTFVICFRYHLVNLGLGCWPVKVFCTIVVLGPVWDAGLVSAVPGHGVEHWGRLQVQQLVPRTILFFFRVIVRNVKQFSGAIWFRLRRSVAERPFFHWQWGGLSLFRGGDRVAKTGLKRRTIFEGELASIGVGLMASDLDGGLDPAWLMHLISPS